MTLISRAKSSSFKQNCHPACPGVPWDRSEAKWRDLRFLSVHPIRRLLIKVTALPFVIPSAVEGSAVRPGSHTKVSVPLVLPQNRHPERSASPIYHLTQCLWRVVEEPVLSGVEGTSAVLSHSCCSELFNHRARTGRARHGLSELPAGWKRCWAQQSRGGVYKSYELGGE